MNFTLEEAQRLAEELRAIPAKDPAKTRLNKQEVVHVLAEDIRALQKRGYTIEEIADSIRGRGFDITTPTLKSYLQRVKSRASNGAKAGRRSADKTPRMAPQPPPKAEGPARLTPAKAQAAHSGDAARVQMEAAAPPPASREPPLIRSGKNAFLIKDKDSY